MKRYGNLYEKIIDIDNIRLAHKNARKNKTKYKEIVEVDKDSEYYIAKIHDMLVNKTYKCSPYEKFLKNDSGKPREIFRVPYFPDRIVQHAIMQILEPIWKKTLINDTFQAIRGRGVHKCKVKVENAVQKLNVQYCLQVDVSKFYPSINNEVLKSTVRKKIKCKDTLNLLDIIIEGHYGVPIGNYISQYFGNLVISDIDHYCKEVLKAKHYYRYCDDIIVLSNNKDYLHLVRQCISEMLRAKGMRLKENYQVYKITKDRGVNCFGFVVFKNETKLRKSILKAFIKVCKSKDDATRSIPSYYGWIKNISNRCAVWNIGHKRICRNEVINISQALLTKLKGIK